MAEGRRKAEWECVAWHLSHVAAFLGAKSVEPERFLPYRQKPRELTTEESASALRAFAEQIGAQVE